MKHFLLISPLDFADQSAESGLLAWNSGKISHPGALRV